MNDQLRKFNEEVVLKYNLYNGLFLALPFGETQTIGTLLAIFSRFCNSQIKNKKSPGQIIDQFFKAQGIYDDEKKIINILFQILQFIERQIVLFDALEDAAFSSTHDLTGNGSLENLLTKIDDKNKQRKFIEQIKQYQVRVVLTAHPTQFYPDTILGILAQLNFALQKNDLKEISNLLLQMGKTSFKHQKKPTPYQEAESLVWFLENVFYPVIPQIQQKITLAIKKFGGSGELNLNCIQLGFWPGGDRDGNPNVTPDTTLEVARLLKTRILQMYLLDIDYLIKKLTFKGILTKLEKIKHKLEKTHLRSQVIETIDINSSIYYKSSELLRDLNVIKSILIKNHNSLFIENIEELIIKVNCFHFYFAKIDLRENSEVHRKIFKKILFDLIKNKKINLKLNQYDYSTKKEKINILSSIIRKKIKYPAKKRQQNVVMRTVKTIQAIKKIQESNGEDGLCRYVISHTSSAMDVLELFTMLQLTGHFPQIIPVDIIPLFEEINDIENSEKIMHILYECHFYRRHLKLRDNTQTIMLGFSDGTKDGGYVAANWSIYKAKLRLTALAKQYGIKTIFFDGRGGPPARGGGNTHLFYRSLGSKIEHHNLQLTVQGQTISVNFGNEVTAKYNLEQLLTAGLEDLVLVNEISDFSKTDCSLMEKLSQESQKHYSLLKNNKLFVPYLEEMTPLRFYGELNIGSRPTTRHHSSTLKFSDLRAIPFVGSWNQIKQNVPGYYGFGWALSKLIKTDEKKLIHLYNNSLFFKTLVENTMMSLSKTFFPLTDYMKKDTKFGPFWKKLAKESKLTEKLILLIAKQTKLLEYDDLNRESIKLREEIVLPLLIIQQYAMVRYKEITGKAKLRSAYKKMILKALAANTNASRNSA